MNNNSTKQIEKDEDTTYKTTINQYYFVLDQTRNIVKNQKNYHIKTPNCKGIVSKDNVTQHENNGIVIINTDANLEIEGKWHMGEILTMDDDSIAEATSTQ